MKNAATLTTKPLSRDARFLKPLQEKTGRNYRVFRVFPGGTKKFPEAIPGCRRFQREGWHGSGVTAPPTAGLRESAPAPRARPRLPDIPPFPPSCPHAGQQRAGKGSDLSAHGGGLVVKQPLLPQGLKMKFSAALPSAGFGFS